jgi:predicted Rossmann-fold nucleotide-binding protein
MSIIKCLHTLDFLCRFFSKINIFLYLSWNLCILKPKGRASLMTTHNERNETGDYQEADFGSKDFVTKDEASAVKGEMKENVTGLGLQETNPEEVPLTSNVSPRKILVAGSRRIQANRNEISELAKTLGKKIMHQNNWILLNGGASETSSDGVIISVDHLVCIGAQEELEKSSEQRIEDRILTLVPEKVDQNLFHKIGKVDTVKGADLSSRRDELAKQADAIITIEGDIGSKEIIEYGRKLHKPVLPIACTGGASKEAWDNYETNILQTFGIKKPSEDYKMLTSTKGLDSTADLSDVIIRIIKNKLETYPPIESPEPLLPPYIERDIWTTNDKLGYDVYATAIAKFLTNENTHAPLCISIQAPWGGGKSSLMRMVQKRLDIDAANLAEKDYKRMSGGWVKLKELKRRIWKKKRERLRRVIRFRGRDGKNEQSEISIKEVQSEVENIEPKVTVWFNAWKYQSTEQVWAGLADSIVTQVAARMDPVERELFFLELNLRRQDLDSIRGWIYGRSLSYVWQKISPWIKLMMIGISSFAVTSILGWINQDGLLRTTGLYGILGAGGFGFIQTLRGHIAANNEPSEASLGNFVNVPDYKDKLGYIHHAMDDLEIVFKTIPAQYQPLIVFIDDLDRCSPNKVAQVIEGINLFLAGDFKGCMFILGMDTDMVAAALEVAHSDVLSKLPKYTLQTPLGWRFMDKFVQLPFVIPPVSNMGPYVKSLFPFEVQKEKGTSKDKDSNVKKTPGMKIIQGLKKIFRSERRRPRTEQISKDDEGSKPSAYDDEGKEKIRVMTEIISALSDKDKEFVEQMSKATSDFSNNPRDFKRFVNALRFQRYVWVINRRFTGKEPASSDQMRRWVVLSLKWPGLVRWLYWSVSGSGIRNQNGSNRNIVRERLAKLENIAGTSRTYQKAWQDQVEAQFDLKVNESPWIGDESLREFFERESTMIEGDRLSASAGRGLY